MASAPLRPGIPYQNVFMFTTLLFLLLFLLEQRQVLWSHRNVVLIFTLMFSYLSSTLNLNNLSLACLGLLCLHCYASHLRIIRNTMVFFFQSRYSFSRVNFCFIANIYCHNSTHHFTFLVRWPVQLVIQVIVKFITRGEVPIT